MGDEWQEEKLGNLLEITSSKRIFRSDYCKNGIPFYRSKEIIERAKGRNIGTELFISRDKFQELKRKFGVPSPGDILLTSVGTLGVAYLVKDGDEFYFKDGNLTWFRNFSERLLPRFLLFWFRSGFAKHAIDKITIGSTQQALTIVSLKSLKIKLPSITKQKSIAHILGTLDDKIELNRRMNATLEAMAQALFRSWFVDFDPVIDNALAAGNPIPEPLHAKAEARKALGDKRKPLPEAIQQQFPSRFVFSEEMGWIPEGWKELQIKDVAEVIKGKSYKSSELSESKTALVTLKSFNRGGGYRLDGLKEYTGGYKPEQEVFAGDLVIAYTDVTQAADVIGKPAMVVSDASYDHLIVSLDVAVVRPEIDAYKFYLYGIAQTERFQSHTYSHSTGTTVLHLGKRAVPDYVISMPSPDLVFYYVSNVEPMFTSIDKNIAEIASLTKLRDTLLPKLLSGELRIPDAEKLVEDAV